MLQTLSYNCTPVKFENSYDIACLNINNATDFQLLAQYVDCENCILMELKPGGMAYLFDSSHDYDLQIMNKNQICKQTFHFDENAVYGWNFTGNNNCSDIFLITPADNTYMPIIAAVIFFVLLGCLWYNFKCMRRCLQKNGSVMLSYLKLTSATSNVTTPSLPLVMERQPKREHSTRLRSVDVFRGFCVLLMIFVNYGGGRYWFFRHETWNGLRIADCVFPWFLWVMGFSIKISLRKRLETLIPRRTIMIQILKRSISLIMVGIVLNTRGSFYKLTALPYSGILQRIGLSYLIVALLEILFTKESPTDDTRSSQKISVFEDFKTSWPQWLVVLSLVGLHTCLTFLLPVPGCPSGYLGPGGLHNYTHYGNCTGGATGYIDRLLFGNPMLRIAKDSIYKSPVKFYPYGLVGTLTSVLTVYMGVHAARILYTYDALTSKIVRWMFWSAITGMIAGFLCNFSKNGGVIPVNKPLWSLSFALGLSSIAFVIECVLHILVDVFRKWGGRPFLYPGMNAILLYIGHLISFGTFPFAWSPNFKNHTNYLIMHLWGTCLWLIISCILYKKNIFMQI